MRLLITSFNLYFVKEEEEREEITPELVARLVTRPEDLPQNVASSIKKYRDMMLRTLEVLCTRSCLRTLILVLWLNLHKPRELSEL